MAVPAATSPVYLLHVELLKTSNPYVSRTLRVPGSSTFKDLSTAILVAFEWSYKTESTWFFCVLLRELSTAGLPFEDLKALLTIVSNESPLVDNELEVGGWLECGETASLSHIFEAFRYRDRPPRYRPESNGAPFSIHVLGTVAMDNAIGIGYIGGQGHTLYEDWDSLYGGRSSWDLNNDVVRDHVARLNEKQGDDCV